ncbi:MAG: S8 family serine peptidase [Candidatus Lokiarchaeota archaeon]|nr:S8 family serine peptidase [Candidatus Lokiarchaeota archaeon]
MEKLRKKSILFILVFIFVTPSIFNIIKISNNSTDIGEFPINPNKEDNVKLLMNLDPIDQLDLNKWRSLIGNADLNENNINDDFEPKLELLNNHKSYEFPLDSRINTMLIEDTTKENYTIERSNISIIIQFPKIDYLETIDLFKWLNGTINSIYDSAIIGFGGSINHNGLRMFYELLNEYDIPFFLEENKPVNTHLYYTSRSMNLRPYVWNTLGYEGDNSSSIAIIDSGIDATHSFFTPGYKDQSFDHKIVGWWDGVNGQLSPYDNVGHGTHCAGIAAGNGEIALDQLNRAVSTQTFDLHDDEGNSSPEEMGFRICRFNVSKVGTIEIYCEFEDLTSSLDECQLTVILLYNDMVVTSYTNDSPLWNDVLSYTVNSDNLGYYQLIIFVDKIDNDGDDIISHFRMRSRYEIHWPFDSSLNNDNKNLWRGVAPQARLVGVKIALDYINIVDGVEWVIENKERYNITTISMSLGGEPGETNLINAVNNAVENGIVTVVSAGNYGPGSNNIGSPGDADNVITVAAMSLSDNIASYSSQGGHSFTQSTTKPDITAPGGSFYNLQMFSADTNDNDGSGIYDTDKYSNDLYGAQGTSMACPAVAGATNLLIEAMGGHQNWEYTGDQAKQVKALILMSATETYPNKREISNSFSPTLERGGKDLHEGYGRINIDTAIEAVTQELSDNSYIAADLSSSVINPYGKHALGAYVNLTQGQKYYIQLDVPTGADFDLHLYRSSPSSIGEPIMEALSISPTLGKNELINFTPSESGIYYLIAKAILGEGLANISFVELDHDLSVSMEIPKNCRLYNSYIINATIMNKGIFSESNVNFFLYYDNMIVNSLINTDLQVNEKKTINFTWIPTELRLFNFTAVIPPLNSETFLGNNIIEYLLGNLEDNYSPNSLSAPYNISMRKGEWLSDIYGPGINNGGTDFFEIFIDEGEYLKLNLEYISQNDLSIQLYDEGLIQLLSTKKDKIEYFPPKSGVHYLGISGTYLESIEYDFWWDDIPIPEDKYEENDHATYAYDLSLYERKFLQPNSYNLSGWGMQGDDDWYKIHIYPGEERLEVNLNFIHNYGDINIEIYNSSLELITWSNSTTDNEYINYILPTSGRYYIKIVGENKGNLYNLQWLSCPYIDDNYEENDIISSAYDISSYEGKWLSDINGFGVSMDSDWYEIYVDEGEELLLIQLTYRGSMNPISDEIYFNVYNDELHREIYKSDYSYQQLSSGVYYILIVSPYDIEYDLWWDDQPYMINIPPFTPSFLTPPNGICGISINPTIEIYFPNVEDEMNCSFYNAENDRLIYSRLISSEEENILSVKLENLEYATEYMWYAVADDGINKTRSPIYSFTTRSPPNIPENPLAEYKQILPIWEGIDILFLSIDVSDPDGEPMDVYFCNASNDRIIHAKYSVLNGTTVSIALNPLIFIDDGSFEWFVIVDDGIDTKRSPTWRFPVKPPNMPENPFPEHNGIVLSNKTVLRVDVSDPDGDSMDVYFCNASNGKIIGVQYNVPNGMTASIHLEPLIFDDNGVFKWYVIVDDGIHQIKSETWSILSLIWSPPKIYVSGDSKCVDSNPSAQLIVILEDIDPPTEGARQGYEIYHNDRLIKYSTTWNSGEEIIINLDNLPVLINEINIIAWDDHGNEAISTIFIPVIVDGRGDVNSDGSIDIRDALFIAQYYVGLSPINFNPDVADVNGDGIINITDALLVARYYVS